MGKGKGGIEGLWVLRPNQAEQERLFGYSLVVADRKSLIDPQGPVADRGD
ncbi:hypothetical protein MCEMKE45_01345 [Candidatus Planktophila vernalis]